MLDKVAPRKALFRAAFRDWWDAQLPAFRERTDYSSARLIFRAGYASGRNRDLSRYTFKTGRFRITVWADGPAEAKQKAREEADFRATRKGWSAPKGGWNLEELK
jgi:hypothetical protein